MEHDDEASIVPRSDDPTVRDAVERVDTTIGPYRLLELIGQGAMGEVWRAEQREPLKRIVALKIIKRGMDTREVVTRFEIERQAMALMEHPWIARVYDAGETASGRPYIAMEYVAGEKLTDYCARNRLSIEDRLRLFQKVCQAIQHAHQKAVIHRDLKPSNILVTEVDGEAVPKVIDFGIAKATAQRLTDRSAATFVGQLIGTPLYMSPEQVEMTAVGVDTRADVYALGVILYELLSGALPHDPEVLARAGLDQVLKVLREEEPARPSTKVSTLGDRSVEVAAQRGLDAKKLAGKLRGDLDWIALKALEKDRKRRYESPRDVADDIERYLRHEAIEARPPSAGYRVSRFVRRHRMGVGLSAIALVALVAFAGWQTVQSGIIARERDRAMANERLSLAREQVEKDPTMAVAYALSSLELLDQPATREVVRRAIAADLLRDEIPRRGAPGNPLSVDASGDGRWLLVAWSQSESPTIGLYDLNDRSMRKFDAPTRGWVWDVTLSSDAQYAVAVASDGLHVWRLSDGAHLFRLFDAEAYPTLAVFAQRAASSVLVAESAPNERMRWFRIDLPDSELAELGTSVGGAQSRLVVPLPAADPRGEWVFVHEGNEVLAQRVADLGSDRVVLLGRHPARVNSVGVDPDLRYVASVDVNGGVRVWDPRVTPSTLLREFSIPQGAFTITTDPHRERFAATWGSETAYLFDLSAHPPRAAAGLLDRSHWTHDATFLPDGTVITSRNGVWVGAVALWRPREIVAWSIDWPDSLGRYHFVQFTPDGRWLYEWTETGAVQRHSVVPGGPGRVERVATTPPVNPGMGYRFEVDAAQTRCITDNSSTAQGVFVHDLQRSERRPLTMFDSEQELMSLSPSGRRAAFVDEYDDLGTDGRMAIVDLDHLEIERTIEPAGSPCLSMRFVGEDSLLALCTDHLALFDLAREDAKPDTLWRGDARRGGLILENAAMVVVLDAERRLAAFEPFGTARYGLGPTSMARIYEASHSARHGCVAIESGGTALDVYELATGRHWSIPMAGKGATTTNGVHFDPLGRWLVTEHSDRVVAWSLPLDPLFTELPGPDFVERVRAKTNVRVVPDPTDPIGFRITNTDENP